MARPETLDCSANQHRLGSGDFITQLRFAPVAASVDDPLVLRVASVWQEKTRILFRYADSSEERLEYSSKEASRFMTIGAILEHPVPWRAAALQTIFIETKASGNVRGVVIAPSLMPRSKAATLHTRLTILYSAFAGLALALIVYNLSLWAATRQRFQLHYCGMVAAMSAYTASSSGFLLLVLPWLDNNQRLTINYMLLAITAVFALQFVRQFFGPEMLGKKLNRTITVLTAIGMLSGLLFAMLAPWQIALLDRFYFAALFAMLCMLPPILLKAWQARSPYLTMFIFAWAAPFITSILRGLYGFNLLPYSFWLDNGNLIALAAEALLSSILVTARLREISLERDDALAGQQLARRLASTDPLTGLLNRRAFLDLSIGRKGQHRLLLIDIDNFKSINDRLGHANGDEVLHAIAGAIQQCRPAHSLAVRLGGEEFAVLVPRASFAECTADTLLDAVRDLELPIGFKVTISIGYADGSVADEERWKRLYRLADSALYRAKSDGKDRACRATDFRVAA